MEIDIFGGPPPDELKDEMENGTMDRVSEAVKKIDELIDEVTADQKLKNPRYSPLRVLTTVRKVLTRSEPKSENP